MLSPITTLYTYFPEKLALRVLLMISIATVCFVALDLLKLKNKISKRKALIVAFLVFYILISLFFTVLSRRSLDYYRYNFDFIQTYSDLITNGSSQDYLEIFLNVFAFMSIGFFVFLLTKKRRIIKTLGIGLIISTFIEILQLIFKSGFCELKDIVNNTFGVILGVLLCALVLFIIKKGKYR